MSEQQKELISFIENGIEYFNRSMNDEKWLRMNNSTKEEYIARKESFQVILNYINELNHLEEMMSNVKVNKKGI